MLHVCVHLDVCVRACVCAGSERESKGRAARVAQQHGEMNHSILVPCGLRVRIKVPSFPTLCLLLMVKPFPLPVHGEGDGGAAGDAGRAVALSTR